MTAIKLGYGLVTCQRHPDHDEGWAPLYAEALTLAEAAEGIVAPALAAVQGEARIDGGRVRIGARAGCRRYAGKDPYHLYARAKRLR